MGNPHRKQFVLNAKSGTADLVSVGLYVSTNSSRPLIERTSAGPRLRSSTFQELDGAIIPPVSDTISSACRSTNEKPPRLRLVEAVSCPSQTRECAPASKRPGPNLKMEWKPPQASKLSPEETPPSKNTPPKNSNGEQDTGGNANSTILSEAPKIDQQFLITNSSTGGNSSKRTVNEILTPTEENPTDNPFVTRHPIEKQKKFKSIKSNQDLLHPAKQAIEELKPSPEL
ncbi:hypothetical protein JTB14_003118 [Gonioctena quinquepunctata]|nr:hypothetical protein JTB14_003118 [Gonioctena quinquepunctata]